MKSCSDSFITVANYFMRKEKMKQPVINWGMEQKPSGETRRITTTNTTNIPESITVSYPEYGSGGIPQLKVDKVITFTEVVIIGD